jgi:hypothetical protein
MVLLYVLIFNASLFLRFILHYKLKVFKPSKPSGNYIYHRLLQSATIFCVYGFGMILSVNSD